MILRIQNTSKRFGKKIAVNNISISLENGIYGLIGANGAGKTTLMNMMCGVTKPSDGEIYINDVSIKEMGKEYRDLLGYLPQHFGCDSSFTVDEYLDYMSCLKGLEHMDGKRMKNKLIINLNLKEYRRTKVNKLSGGTKRRVGVAQALLNDPMILILDEPTAGLDPGERVKIRQMIAGMGKEKIILISTHIVSDIENISTYNLIMRQGEIVASGTTNQLVESIDGRVWSVFQKNNNPVYAVNGEIINIHHEKDNMVNIRYIGGADNNHHAIKEQANLEDVYFYYNYKGR